MIKEPTDNLKTGDQVRLGWSLLQSQRPQAAWAVWQAVLRENPSHQAAAEALAHLAEARDLPEVARKQLRFQSPTDEEQRTSWDLHFKKNKRYDQMSDPGSAGLVFKALLDQNPNDSEATWNLAVCLTWAGSNQKAIEVLDQYVSLTASHHSEKASEAWTLAELLRHGAGAEPIADNTTESITFHANGLETDLSTVALTFGFPKTFQKPSVDDARYSDNLPEIADLLDYPLSQDDLSYVHVVASYVREAGKIRFSQPSGSDMNFVMDEIFQLSQGVAGLKVESQIGILPLHLLDSNVARFRISDALPEHNRNALCKHAVSDFFESVWIHQPRNGLNQLTPFQASEQNQPIFQAKLEGIITFLEQLARRPASRDLYQDYDFDRLRYRLGLIQTPGSIDAKGEARHQSLLWFNNNHVKTVSPEKVSETYILTAWETATACRSDKAAIALGAKIQNQYENRFSEISLARWVAPWLRKALRDRNLNAGLEKLSEAIQLDRSYRMSRELSQLLQWKAELISRLGNSEDAAQAWLQAIEQEFSTPVMCLRAVIELENDSPKVAETLCRELILRFPDRHFCRVLLQNWLNQKF